MQGSYGSGRNLDRLSTLVRNPRVSGTPFQQNILNWTVIAVSDADSHWYLIYTYQVLVFNQGVPNTEGHWEFTDETGDTYKLLILEPSTDHAVHYNSKRPNIVSIKVKPF